MRQDRRERWARLAPLGLQGPRDSQAREVCKGLRVRLGRLVRREGKVLLV